MPTIFEKLNLKDQRGIVIINAPDSFEPELANLRNVSICRDLKNLTTFQFGLAFATTQAEVDRLSTSLAKKAEGDVLLWMAYPKGTSRRYTCDFNRDTGWKSLRDLGFDTVARSRSTKIGRPFGLDVSSSSSRQPDVRTRAEINCRIRLLWRGRLARIKPGAGETPALQN